MEVRAWAKRLVRLYGKRRLCVGAAGLEAMAYDVHYVTRRLDEQVRGLNSHLRGVIPPRLDWQIVQYDNADVQASLPAECGEFADAVRANNVHPVDGGYRVYTRSRT